MNQKKLVIIIGIVVFVVLIIIGLGVFLFTEKAKTDEETQKMLMEESEPELNLSLNTEKPDQENVIIKAVANTNNQNEIDSIVLPDGSTVKDKETEYEVTENGEYEFKAKGKNGKSISKTIKVSNIMKSKSLSPYIPEGFSHKEGDVDEGFVIQDQYENEFVWVPVEKGKITRKTKSDDDYEETSSTATALVNSVAKNYGFYIGRYESTAANADGTIVAMSKAGCMPWTNITFLEADKVATNFTKDYGYEDCQSAILNSYAWDATLNWIEKNDENYSSSTSYGNYSGEIRKTGETESDRKNNIFDLAGNVREWTTEIYKVKETVSDKKDKNTVNTTNVVNEIVEEIVNYRVIRGGSAVLNKTANSHTGYKESMSDNYWGFRLILYK